MALMPFLRSKSKSLGETPDWPKVGKHALCRVCHLKHIDRLCRGLSIIHGSRRSRLATGLWVLDALLSLLIVWFVAWAIVAFDRVFEAVLHPPPPLNSLHTTAIGLRGDSDMISNDIERGWHDPGRPAAQDPAYSETSAANAN